MEPRYGGASEALSEETGRNKSATPKSQAPLLDLTQTVQDCGRVCGNFDYGGG